MHSRVSISRSFLLVDGLRSVGQASRLLDRTGPRYLMVAVGETPDHYLFAARDFQQRAAGVAPSSALLDSGLLDGMRPAMAGTASEAAGGEPRLMFADGVLVGVLATRHARKAQVLFSGTRPAHPGEDPAGEGAPVRYVKAELPDEVPVGESVILAVEVSAELRSLADSVRVDLPDGAELDVVVHAKEGFAVEGRGYGTLRIPDEGSTARVEFRLRAETAGAGLVRVYAIHDGGVLGSLTLRPCVRPAEGGRVGPAPASRLQAADALASAAQSGAADLSLLILEERTNDGPVLRIRLTARDAELGLNLKEFGPVSLGMEPIQYFRDFFGDIEALGASELIQKKLESKGARLYEALFPEELRALLWSLRDRIASIQIQSDEAWIPWELCRLTGISEGVVVEERFFCEAFELTRWIPGIARRPQLTLNNMAVVVPSDSRLGAVREERAFLLSLAEGNRSVSEVPARYVDVRGALAGGSFDGFHFSGHGVSSAADPDRSAIRLEAAEELRPEEISGVLRNLGRSRPIVFLNSCYGARGGVTIVGTGGWARRCLDAGAGAFIGAYWSVSDEAASAFAQAFYCRVRDGMSLGAAVRSARAAICRPDDPTWLAYTVFGDPSAVVRT
jgi:hypothetical protein